MWVWGLPWLRWICPSVCCDPSSHGLEALWSADYWVTKPVWVFCLLLWCFWLNILRLPGFKWGWTKFVHLLGLEFELVGEKKIQMRGERHKEKLETVWTDGCLTQSNISEEGKIRKLLCSHQNWVVFSCWWKLKLSDPVILLITQCVPKL